MIVRPVERYHLPRYPDRDDVLHNQLIMKSLPQRWARNAVTKTAVTVTIAMMLTGCGLKYPPVFIHGDGVGGFGCSSIAPPKFMSEGEARIIIN
jgi:hypothetical protein